MKHVTLDTAPTAPVSHDPSLIKHVLIPPGAVPNLRHFCHITLAPGSTASTHTHTDGREVFYCIRGDIVYKVNGEDVVLTGGHCLVVEPGEAHSISAVRAETELLYFYALTSS